MEKIFDGQTVIISGGLGDIGLAVAQEFVARGASIAIGDIHTAKEAHKVLGSFVDRNIKFHYKQVDVTDVKAVEAWVNEVENILSIPSIIIPNAAIVTVAGVLQVKPEQWVRELDVNLNGSFFLAQIAARRLVEHQLPGRIVFVGSWAAHSVHANLAPYCASKAGIRMLCKCMALELAPHNILVNEIALGYVQAGLSGRIWKSDPNLEKQAIEKVPVKKLIQVEEVARQMVYVCHPQNEHMTGSTILLDGGLSLHSK
ncbi:MAG: SDR family oxidoreductase [Flavobacteriaceae bacterium]